MTNDFFRWSPRTPTTGYFLATLRVAEVSQLYECPLMGLYCYPLFLTRRKPLGY